ncbi:MAG: FxsA family protein, partial [Acidimicrobiia bacterium]|nr:FxsA family protein [Acidimicrobiia bacterium]
MAAVLVLVFLVVPLAELYVIIQVGSAIGTLNTVALLLIMG